MPRKLQIRIKPISQDICALIVVTNVRVLIITSQDKLTKMNIPWLVTIIAKVVPNGTARLSGRISVVQQEALALYTRASKKKLWDEIRLTGFWK